MNVLMINGSPKPNGNTAILIWENKTYDEALAKGRDPKDKALSRNGMPAPGHGRPVCGDGQVRVRRYRQ